MEIRRLLLAVFILTFCNWALLIYFIFTDAMAHATLRQAIGALQGEIDRIKNKRPRYEIGTLIYYRDGYNELCVGKVLKVIKNGIIEYMIQAENNTILILNEGEILGEYGKVNFN